MGGGGEEITFAQDLIRKVAIVTGAGNPGNIGAVTAQVLAEGGARVDFADIPGTKLPEIVAALTHQGLQVTACDVDISDQASVKKLYEPANWTRSGAHSQSLCITTKF